MKRLLGLAGLVLASVLAGAQPCIGAPANEPAGGLYPEQRIFLESQVWWVNTGPQPFAAGTNHGHIHLGLCFPYKQTVSGFVQFNLRVILHNSTGTIKTLRISDGSSIKWKKTVSLSCPNPGTCTWWMPVLFDTASVAYDGRREFRFTADIPSGSFPDSADRMFQSSGWQMYLANGWPMQNFVSTNITIGTGWYTDMDYVYAKVKSDLPLTPVGGTFAPSVYFYAFPGHVSQCDVLLDPDFHAVPPISGTLLFEGLTESVCKLVVHTLSINTLALSNGPHKLVLRGKQPTTRNGQSVLMMGIQVVPFVVQN